MQIIHIVKTIGMHQFRSEGTLHIEPYFLPAVRIVRMVFMRASGVSDINVVRLRIKHLFSRPLQGDGVSRLTLGINGAYTYTCAKVPLATDPSGSQLEGAAPWIANADLTYLYRKGTSSLTAALVFNYFSDRIYTIGTEGYQDIIENGIPTLDFVGTAKLGKHFSVNLKARNLLNSTHQLTRESSGNDGEVVLSKYRKGVDLSIGVAYNL